MVLLRRGGGGPSLIYSEENMEVSEIRGTLLGGPYTMGATI